MKAGKDIRKVVRVGNSVGIILPFDYVKSLNLRPGDLVEVYYNRTLQLEPVDQKEILRKLHKGEDV
jgi:antitoxin component of MazEF toxin-antitoxin module